MFNSVASLRLWPIWSSCASWFWARAF